MAVSRNNVYTWDHHAPDSGENLNDELVRLNNNDGELEDRMFENTGGTISGDVVVEGNLSVQGDTRTLSQSETADNVITLNSGESGSGVTSGKSGLEVDRGTETSAVLHWLESTGAWVAGLLGSESPIVRLIDTVTSPNAGKVPAYDSSGRLKSNASSSGSDVVNRSELDDHHASTSTDHDDRYDPSGTVDSKITTAIANHHASTSTDHDDRYYTESEINTKLNGKSDTGHVHGTGDITSGTISKVRLPSDIVYDANLSSFITQQNGAKVYLRTFSFGDGDTHIEISNDLSGNFVGIAGWKSSQSSTDMWLSHDYDYDKIYKKHWNGSSVSNTQISGLLYYWSTT